MKPESPFSQIDHPLIMVAQILIAFYSFRLFFKIRKNGQPLPQIVAGVAFGVLANLCARYTHSDWFLSSDIAQYLTIAVAFIVAYYSVTHSQKEEAAQADPDAPVIKPDFFDKIENRAVWGFGLILVGILVFAYVQSYTEKQFLLDREKVVADSTAAAKDAEHTAQLCETQEKLETTLTAVTSISATQTTMLANQVAAAIDRKKVAAELKSQIKQAKTDKKASRPTVPDVGPLKTTPTKETPVDNRNFWQKATQFLRSNKTARADSSNIVRPDTLVYNHY